MKKRKYASGSMLGSALNTSDTPLETAVYGDSSQDPIMRLVGDITGSNTKAARDYMFQNLNYNTAPVDNTTLMDRITNTPRYSLNTDGKGAGYHILDNLQSSAQGALQGASFSSSPWALLIGGIIGGAANIASQVDEPRRKKLIEGYINSYDKASAGITNDLIYNSNKALIDQYMANRAALGGPLNTHGGNFSNGLFEIANGGTHEENPYEGVPMGMDQDGNPNLVEEGEWIYNDYVFSKRLKTPDAINEKYKLAKGGSFADAVNKVQRESEERPNDPISKRGLQSALTELAMAQEIVRAQEQQKEQEEMNENLAAFAADGGPIHIAKNKRGTFTAAASKHNMGVQEFASHVLANKDNYSPLMVKKANFARNASKWKHAHGGNLFAIGGPYEDYLTNLPDYAKAYNTAMDMIYPYRNAIGTPIITKMDLNELSQPSEFEDFENASIYQLPTVTIYPPANKNVNPNWNSPLRAAAQREYPKELSYEPYNIRVNRLPSDEDLDNSYEYDLSDIPDLDDAVQKAYDKKYPATPVETKSAGENTPLPTWMRYAPIGMAAAALLNNLKPIDYSNADRVGEAARNINRFKGAPQLSNYMQYTPVNTNAEIAKINARKAADLRAVTDLSNLNPATRQAALTALSAQYGDTLGDTLARIEDINQARRKATEQFNSAINSTNAELQMNAAAMNQKAEEMYNRGILQEALMRQGLEAAQSQAVSDAYNTISEGLGDIGNENAYRNMMQNIYPFLLDDNFLVKYGFKKQACGGKLRKVK